MKIAESAMNDEISLPLSRPSAEEITELEQHVRDRLASQLYGFRLTVGSEGLILQGRTRTYLANQLAQHALMEVAMLLIQAYEIEVT